jgi:hypothetical protein
VLGLQRRAGNRQVARLLAGKAAPDRPLGPTAATKAPERAGPPPAGSRPAVVTPGAPSAMVVQPPVRRGTVAEGGPVTVQRVKTPAGEKVEIQWELANVVDRVKVSGRLTAAKHGATFLEGPSPAPGGGSAAWSLVENKATIKRGAGKWGAALSTALGKWDWGGPVPGFEYLKVKFEAKAIEGKFDLVKKEADLDLLKVGVELSGDAAPLLAFAGLGHLADRVKVDVKLKAEVGIGPTDLARLRTAFRAKEELQAATKALEAHAKGYAKAAEELKVLERQRNRLKGKLQSKLDHQGTLRQQLDELRSEGPKRSTRGAKRAHARRIKGLQDRLKRVDADVAQFEKQLGRNTTKAKDAWSRAKAARKGLGEAGGILHKAGRRLDSALKGVSGTIGKAGKKALDKATGKIVKRLGKTLAKKIIAKLVPGLNVVSTVLDLVEVGGALWDLATGKRRFGLPLEDEFGGEDGGDGGTGGDGGMGGTEHARPDAGGDTGGDGSTDGDAGPVPDGGGEEGGVDLEPAVRAVLETVESANLVVDPDDAEVLNQLVPTDITPEEAEELRRRLGGGSGVFDPYEVAAAIQSQLDDIRAGGTRMTVDGEEVEVDRTEAAEPPKTLLPATRSNVQASLDYDEDSGRVVFRPEERERVEGATFPHPDGLEVRISTIDVDSTVGADDIVVVKVSFDLEVARLPEAADADYPYSVGQTATESMTFLYSPSKELWGEIDYGMAHALRDLLARDGGGWRLTKPGTVLTMEYSEVRVDELAGYKHEPIDSGGVRHLFALRVTPLEITGEEAGYRYTGGWVRFEKGKSVIIPFAFTEEPQPASAE